MKHISGKITALSLAVGSTTVNGFSQDKPNVLLICVDDLNDWIGVLKGHPGARTPYLDQLSRQGVIFTNAYCQVPLSGPSRASFMTGLYPFTTGIYGQIEDEDIKKKAFRPQM